MNPASSWCFTEISLWNQMSWVFPLAFPYRASRFLLNSSPRSCRTFSRKSFWTRTSFPKISLMFISPSSCKVSRALLSNGPSASCSELFILFFQVPPEDKGTEQILQLAPDGIGKAQLKFVNLVLGALQNKRKSWTHLHNTHTFCGYIWWNWICSSCFSVIIIIFK